MTTFLLSWLSKSSSASTSLLSTTDSPASSLSLLPSSSSLILSEIPSLSSSTGQDSSLEQRHNYLQILDAPHQPRSFHFPRCPFGNKKVLSEDLMRVGLTVTRGCTMMKAKIWHFAFFA